MIPPPAHGATRSLRLGIVGFGRLAHYYYAPALRSMDGIRSILVADPSAARRALARKSLRAETCDSPDDLLPHKPDAILVASPPSTHLQIWNAASRAAVPVFMEKPFVLNGELARAESSPNARRLMMIDFDRRFWPVYVRLRELVRGGAIGAPQCAQFWLHIDLRAWCTVTSHRLSPREGGALYDLGSQILDLVSYVFDADPRSIEAETSSRRWDADHVRLDLGFSSGLRVRCDLAYSDRNREGVAIWGHRGRVRLNDPNMAVHLDRGISPAPAPLARGKDLLLLAYRAIRRNQSMGRYSVRAALAAFLRAVRLGDEFSPGFEDAAKNTMWLEAASRALRRRAAADAGPRNAAGHRAVP